MLLERLSPFIWIIKPSQCSYMFSFKPRPHHAMPHPDGLAGARVTVPPRWPFKPFGFCASNIQRLRVSHPLNWQTPFKQKHCIAWYPDKVERMPPSKISEDIAEMKSSSQFLCKSFDEIKVSNKQLQNALQEIKKAMIKWTSELTC